jgi:type IV secretory pathway TrbF-like protein
MDNDESTKDQTAIDAPWLKAQMAYNDTFLRLAAQVANWRMFAFISLAIASFSVIGLIYVGAQSKFVPFLVEVDKLGRTVAVRSLTGEDAIRDPQRLVYREMFDLIEHLRSVSTDPEANKKNITMGFSRLTGSATVYVRTELRKALPNEVAQTKTVQVQVKAVLPISANTNQIEWEEHSFDLQGNEIGVDKWKATVVYKLAPPEAEEGIRINPIGFFASEISWVKVL